MKAIPVDVMSVDVEDWHSATILQLCGILTPPSDDVERNTLRLLYFFETHHVKATWFFLGEVAEKFPQLVRKVIDCGHEAGVHGFHHHQIQRLTASQLEGYILRAKDVVEQAGRAPVLGYRAVDFGVNEKTWYLFDILLKAGFKYDCSIFPFSGPRYGMGHEALRPHWVTASCGKRIFEIPVGVANFLGIRIPATGGGYFRNFPLFFTKFIIDQIHREGRPAVFYLHPCELEVPTTLGPFPAGMTPANMAAFKKYFRSQVRNRKYTEVKLRKLLREFQFRTVREVFNIDKL